MNSNDIVGKVISINGTPNTNEFWFVVLGNVKKDDFVSVKVGDEDLLCRVDEIVSGNEYFSVPETMKEFSPEDFFPTSEWEFSMARAIPLMVMPSKSRLLYPVHPGDRVEKADKSLIKSFYSFDDNGLFLGKKGNIDVKLNLSKLFQKHVAILAMSGAGKSYLTSVIIEELLKRPKSRSLSVVLFDVHGEYTQFYEDKKFRDRVELFPVDEIRIAANKMSPTWPLFKSLSSAQRRLLGSAIRKLKKEKRVFSIDDMISFIESENKTGSGVVADYLEELKDMKLFGVSDSPAIENLCKQGFLSIIDFSKTISQKKRQLIVQYFGSQMFSMRMKGSIPPFVFIVEEAHNFAPQNVEIEKSISRGIIEKIAREGRKFGASLMMISQRPVHLSTTALSQCGTKIILRVTNPYDIDNIKRSSEGLDASVLNKMPSLSVGEAIIVGEATGFPLVFKVRKKEVMDSDKGFDLESLAEKYAERERKGDDDLNAFM